MVFLDLNDKEFLGLLLILIYNSFLLDFHLISYFWELFPFLSSLRKYFNIYKIIIFIYFNNI